MNDIFDIFSVGLFSTLFLTLMNTSTEFGHIHGSPSKGQSNPLSIGHIGIEVKVDSVVVFVLSMLIDFVP